MKLRLVTLCLVVTPLLPAVAQATPRTAVTPRAVCVERQGRSSIARFAATGRTTVRVPAGARNKVVGGEVVGKHPVVFSRERTTLRVRMSAATVRWRLGSATARISRNGAPCTSGAVRRTVGSRRAAGRPPMMLATPATPHPAQPPTQETSPDRPLPPPTAGPLMPAPAFSPSSFWNATIPSNVAFAQGSSVTGTAADGTPVAKPINPTAGLELATFAKRADGSSNTWINYKDYTAPITMVAKSVPLQPVRLCRFYPNDCVPSWAWTLDQTLRGIAVDGRYLGGGVPVPEGFVPPNDSDAEAIIYQPDYVAPDVTRGRVYELWGMRANPDFDAGRPVSPTNARWMAAWGGRLVGTTGQGSGYWTDCWWSGCGYQADTYADADAWGRPDSQARDHNWGATATSLSLLGTTVSLRECRAGQIDHTVGIEVPEARPGWWWPAQRGDGGDDSLVLTEGMRLTFPPSAQKPAGLTAVGSALWDAAQRYGLIVDDKTGWSLNFRVEPGCEQTAWWGNVAAYDQLRGFPWSELRVIAAGTDGNPNSTL